MTLTTETQLFDDFMTAKFGADYAKTVPNVAMLYAVWAGARETVAPVEIAKGFVFMPAEINEEMKEAWANGGVTMEACYRSMFTVSPAMPNPPRYYEPPVTGLIVPHDVARRLAEDFSPKERVTPDRMDAIYKVKELLWKSGL